MAVVAVGNEQHQPGLVLDGNLDAANSERLTLASAGRYPCPTENANSALRVQTNFPHFGLLAWLFGDFSIRYHGLIEQLPASKRATEIVKQQELRMINVSDLAYSYTGTTELAIKNISFAVQPGEIFGLLGPSGAGKSTTQKILFRLLQGFQGSVRVFDRDLREWGYDYFEQVGVSFEMPNHYTKLTASENLRYFGALYQGNVKTPEELLEMVGLLDDADMLVSQYSKGMKNRLSVARSLVNDPKLLFLDEPTAGLDPVNARKIKDLIKSQKDAGKTVFLTTHDMHIADELCDRVAFIVDGQLSLTDSPRELKLRYGKAEVRVEFSLNGKNEQRDFELAGLADNAEFLKLLRECSVRTLHSQEATLENIFIQITGRRLE